MNKMMLISLALSSVTSVGRAAVEAPVVSTDLASAQRICLEQNGGAEVQGQAGAYSCYRMDSAQGDFLIEVVHGSADFRCL